MVSKIVVILSPVCFDKVQFRFPRTNKKRIVKKWKTKKENYKEKNISAEEQTFCANALFRLLLLFFGGKYSAPDRPSEQYSPS